MSRAKPTLHLVCTAHLDPVWQWNWQEGCLEALTTFKHAVEYLDEFSDLIFTHNEAVLYEWVERHDPELFEDIRGKVASGRWHISGGWLLQPDCNMPNGEMFFRLAEYGRRYFKERFSVTPRIAYNFDAFGHNGSLPQILRRLGYEMYVHTRPAARDLTLPGHLYRWEGIDGSSIVTYRSPTGSYTHEEGQVEERVFTLFERCEGVPGDQMMLWGVGDHGGGPARADLALLSQLIARDDLPYRLEHSTPERFLDAISPSFDMLPVHKGDLQKCFPGCYTSDAATKGLYHRVDSRLIVAERYGYAAQNLVGARWDARTIDAAWRNHMFTSGRKKSVCRPSLRGPIEISDRRILLLGTQSDDDSGTWRLRCGNSVGESITCTIEPNEAAAVPLTFRPFEVKEITRSVLGAAVEKPTLL